MVQIGETDKSRFEMHVCNGNHRVRSDKTSILTKEDQPTERKLEELAHNSFLVAETSEINFRNDGNCQNNLSTTIKM